jgi:tRNA-modifying protein YgfZ
MTALSDFHTQHGATFHTALANVPWSFGNEEEAIAAASSGIAVIDRTHWGRIAVGGADRLRFLHNQSTADFTSLAPGMGCDTVFINSTGRTIDLALALVLHDQVHLLVSPSQRETIYQLLDRFIFFADKVELQDITANTATFGLIGAASTSVVKALGGQPDTLAYSHQVLPFGGASTIRIVSDSGLAMPGYTIFVDIEQALPLWQKLVEMGAVPMGEKGWEELRIRQGRPAAEAELTVDYNPLEVGLWQSISFTKGCYIGQETIARLNTYKGVKQYLWGIKLQGAVAIGSPLLIADEKVGILTSYTETTTGHQGLAYVKSKAGGIGLRVEVGNTTGEIVDLPFVSHDYYTP